MKTRPVTNKILSDIVLRMKTKERILHSAAELFNSSGVGPVTTNHIAKAMGISPGNLYFHYSNKEEVLFELFMRMCDETYALWKPRRGEQKNLIEFINLNYELYWRYRFFHREMYALRRKDKALARKWKSHIQKMYKLMRILYLYWVREGVLVSIADSQELLYVSEALLAMATTFLQFFESSEKQAQTVSLARGKRHLVRLLLPYTQGTTREECRRFLAS